MKAVERTTTTYSTVEFATPSQDTPNGSETTCFDLVSEIASAVKIYGGHIEGRSASSSGNHAGSFDSMLRKGSYGEALLAYHRRLCRARVELRCWNDGAHGIPSTLKCLNRHDESLQVSRQQGRPAQKALVVRCSAEDSTRRAAMGSIILGTGLQHLLSSEQANPDIGTPMIAGMQPL